MNDVLTLKPIAHIKTDFPTKFGIPRQSGIVDTLIGKIIFEDEFRDAQAIRCLDEYSHIWLIWGFSLNGNSWSSTVRPPKLGGNKRVGVFASRSPFRPNPLGLSSVKIIKIENDKNCGPVIYVSGADLMDHTPIYDIKPYLVYTDSHPEALGGYSKSTNEALVKVEFPEVLLFKLPSDIRHTVISILAQDPHPSYKNDPYRIYYMEYSDFEIGFTVGEKGVSVCSVKNRQH